MFLDLPGQYEATNRLGLARSVDWWCQIGLGGPGTCTTGVIFGLIWGWEKGIWELGMFLDLPGQSDGTNRQISARSVDWWC